MASRGGIIGDFQNDYKLVAPGIHHWDSGSEISVYASRPTALNFYDGKFPTGQLHNVTDKNNSMAFLDGGTEFHITIDNGRYTSDGIQAEFTSKALATITGASGDMKLTINTGNGRPKLHFDGGQFDLICSYTSPYNLHVMLGFDPGEYDTMTSDLAGDLYATREYQGSAGNTTLFFFMRNAQRSSHFRVGSISKPPANFTEKNLILTQNVRWADDWTFLSPLHTSIYPGVLISVFGANNTELGIFTQGLNNPRTQEIIWNPVSFSDFNLLYAIYD